MQAGDIMSTRVVTVDEDASVAEIAAFMNRFRISAVPVVDDDNRVVGIVSEGDLMRRPETGTDRPPAWWLMLLLSSEEQAAKYVKTHGRRATEIMTHGVVTVSESATLEEVADVLERHRIKRAPVLRDGKLVGIISRADLLRGLATAKGLQPATSDDQTIRAAILEALRLEAGVRHEFVNVTVSDGTVHLWGMVESPEERDAIRVVAENAIGVRAVEDRLGVIPPTARWALWAQ
jgi:CBS domain-containing protein